MEQIGKRLRALREGVRLTQVQMAQILGVQQSRINRYETGQSTPAPEIFLKYADYFDVSMDYLYCRTKALCAVLNHALEVRAVVSLGGHGAVNIRLQNGDVILLAVGHTFPKLALNAFFPLVIAGIAGVNHCFHVFSCPSSMMRNNASFRRLLTGACGSKHISINSRIS